MLTVHLNCGHKCWALSSVQATQQEILCSGTVMSFRDAQVVIKHQHLPPAPSLTTYKPSPWDLMAEGENWLLLTSHIWRHSCDISDSILRRYSWGTCEPTGHLASLLPVSALYMAQGQQAVGIEGGSPGSSPSLLWAWSDLRQVTVSGPSSVKWGEWSRSEAWAMLSVRALAVKARRLEF